ncbi:AraC family transcriptional regulator [Paenibacillus eucommiae]|uniref:AraC-like DNA-binding protein n=1 Tax=Paenibacillus eucommiae TaxID=1355755 RepID=A0ABS4IRI5_9BACL|nr:AraC family transcriptional regulator [Paenibacillus eucommiae]MBP1990184.1 AraC-like DNA-binding protein [Paenibacillus eucommiae]
MRVIDQVFTLRSSQFFSEQIPFFIHQYAYDNYDELKLHVHDFIEIVYVCKGKGLHKVGNRLIPVSEGDLFIINNDTPHCFYPYDRTNTDGLEVYNCMFLPAFIEHLQIELPIMRGITSLFLLNGLYPEETAHTPDLMLGTGPRKEFDQLFGNMLHEYQTKQEGYLNILKLQLCELLIKTYRTYKSLYQDAPHPDTYKLELIQKSIQYMRSNLSSPIQLNDLSQQALLSKSYFSGIFKNVTGISVLDYLQKLRIEEACRLLVEDTKTVTDISESVGYNDYRFFNKTFRKITGMTASAYRKQFGAAGGNHRDT